MFLIFDYNSRFMFNFVKKKLIKVFFILILLIVILYPQPLVYFENIFS